MPDAKTTKMPVEIWSDVVCPFCYIGKRRFERALAEFPHRDRIAVAWRSFQLQPDAQTDPTLNAVQHLARRKNWTLEQTRQAMAEVSARARLEGLTFDYERTVVANTFDAHRLSHFAAVQGKGDALHERLFQAYFTDGLNIGDSAVLAMLAVDAGLPAADAAHSLSTDQFAAEVRRDIDQAARFGINAVPFFVFNHKYAVSGAQDAELFLQALHQSFDEWSGSALVSTTSSPVADGEVCDPRGHCN